MNLTMTIVRAPRTSSIMPARMGWIVSFPNTIIIIPTVRTPFIPVSVLRLLVALLPPISALKWHKRHLLFCKYRFYPHDRGQSDQARKKFRLLRKYQWAPPPRLKWSPPDILPGPSSTADKSNDDTQFVLLDQTDLLSSSPVHGQFRGGVAGVPQLHPDPVTSWGTGLGTEHQH